MNHKRSQSADPHKEPQLDAGPASLSPAAHTHASTENTEVQVSTRIFVFPFTLIIEIIIPYVWNSASSTNKMKDENIGLRAHFVKNNS